METDLGQGLPAFKDLVQEVKELEKRSSVSVRKKISFEELEQPLPQIQTEMEKIEFGALVAEVFKAEKAIASTYYDSQLNVPLDNISQVQKQITLKEATALLDKKRASAGLAAQKQQVSEPKKTLGQKKPEAVKEIEAGPKPQETNAQVLPPHDVAVPTQKGVGTAKAAQDARVAQKLPKQAQTPAQAIELLKKGILENIVASKVAKTGKGLALQGGQIEPGVLAKEEKRLGQITQAVSAGIKAAQGPDAQNASAKQEMKGPEQQQPSTKLMLEQLAKEALLFKSQVAGTKQDEKKQGEKKKKGEEQLPENVLVIEKKPPEQARQVQAAKPLSSPQTATPIKWMQAAAPPQVHQPQDIMNLAASQGPFDALGKAAAGKKFRFPQLFRPPQVSMKKPEELQAQPQQIHVPEKKIEVPQQLAQNQDILAPKKEGFLDRLFGKKEKKKEDEGTGAKDLVASPNEGIVTSLGEQKRIMVEINNMDDTTIANFARQSMPGLYLDYSAGKMTQGQFRFKVREEIAKQRGLPPAFIANVLSRDQNPFEFLGSKYKK